MMVGVLMGLMSAAWALPPVPAPLALTAEEEATLDKGELVFRNTGSGESITIIDVSASPERVMAAVMDLGPRVNDVSSLLAFEEYQDAPGRKAARWELGASVYSATFHVLYEYDVAKGWCVFTLDTSKENDIQSTDGSYQVYAHDGGTRLVYRSAQQNSILPSWLMQRFAREGATEMLTGMKRRAGG